MVISDWVNTQTDIILNASQFDLYLVVRYVCITFKVIIFRAVGWCDGAG